MVVIGHKRHNYRLDFRPRRLARSLTLSDLTGANCDFITHLQATLEDGATCDATFQSLGVLSWLIDIEGTNDNHIGWYGELARGDRNSAQVVDNNIDIVLKHG